MAFPSLEPGMSRPSSGIASPPARSRSRTQSISSDRPSTIGQHSLMSPPLSVSPEAAFIARSAASQIVTNDHDSHADTWYDQHGIEPSGESASVSDAALRLVNSFLDQLLFNFLSLAGSTTLPALRPAVSQVLKPKLAKDAINQAEEELREYLGGGDDDELLQGPGAGPKDWDLELVWKRTRLRCMVYSSLGDLEEEDEDYHMEEENLEMGDETLGETVSPAVAIFLTSILEFMGEQALIVAGQAAYHRMRARYEKEMKEGSKTPADAADRITVEDVDMERVALDRTLGRLWRAWKKRIRSPGLGTMEHFPRPRSRDSSHASQLNHLRQLSLDPESSIPQAVTEKPDEHEQENLERTPQKEGPVPPLEEYLVAAAIPLPAGENDVAEIEVPGLATYSDDESEDNEVEDDTQPIRPKSLMIFPPANTTDLPTPTMSQPNTPVFATRKRSNSLPTPATSPYRSVLVRETVAPTIGASPESITDVERDASREISTKELSKERRASEQTPVLDETSDTESNTEESNQLASKRLSTVIGDIAVVGPTTTLDSADEADANDQNEEDDTIEFTEEPQILTSSRISISGRSSSPASSDHGRSMPLSPIHPVRSGSIHSLRLVDVMSPRSPTTRSRGSSIYEPEQISHSRAGNLSRTSSVTTPPIVEESRKADDPPRPSRSSVAHSLGPLKTSAADSISETEELGEPASAVSAMTPATETKSSTVSQPRPEASLRHFNNDEAQPIFGSVIGHTTSPPRSPVKQQTKVTILGSVTSSGSFYIEDEKPQVPAKSAISNTVPAPVVPERSMNRHSPAAAEQVPPPQGDGIGSLSVERSSGRRESPEFSRPSQDHQNSLRHLHTSESSTSSSTSKMKAMRASQESSRTRPEDVARNFEELIHSDQTIQYTLTPESMRDMDSTRSITDGSPLMPTKSRKSEDARQANGSRSRSSSVARPADRKRSVSVSRTTGLNSHPVEASQSGGKLTGPVPRAPPVSMQNRLRANGPQARDARIPRESLADFAEFIRATGPVEDAKPAAVRRNPDVVRSASGPLPSSASKASIDSGRPSTTTSNRLRLQARGAVVDYRDDNSDLIDFIRRGPPNSGGNPRIPRTVAPFRTTMDSDQMTGAIGGKAVDATIPDLRYSQASTNVTDLSMPSVQSSVNSQTALLGRNKPLPTQSHNQFDDEDMMPKRKTRRVRDPYAIDFSDEEEDDDFEEMPRRRAQPKEESLMDFLRNAPPPPQSSPVPLNIPQTRTLPKKKASATSLIARFARHGSSGSNSLRSPTTRPATSTPDSKAPNSRGHGGSRGFVPIQVSVASGNDRSVPSRSSSIVGGSNAQSMHPAGRATIKKFQPREAVPKVSREVTDLADFLRNSEPPPSMNNGNSFAAVDREESSGFSRVFARRKKSTLA